MLKLLYFILVLRNFVHSDDLENPLASACSQAQEYPRNCIEAQTTAVESNIHLIQVDSYGPKPFVVACESNYGGGWTIIHRRNKGDIDFYRGWNDYKFGFGDWTREFWLGLEKIHALTSDALHELLIVMEPYIGQTAYARYDLFAVGDENESYALKLLGNFTGTAGDSLNYHRAQKFATYDRDSKMCASYRKGAWWYNSTEQNTNTCAQSNLNGIYYKFGAASLVSNHWFGFQKHGSLKFTQMMIRPKI